MHRNTIVIYHKDQDGLAAAFPFSVLNPVFIEFTHPLFKDYFDREILVHAKQGAIFYFLDCAPPPNDANRLASKGADVFIHDHHWTTAQRYAGHPNINPKVRPFFRMDRCGAMLADEYAANNPEIFGVNNRVDAALLPFIDKADRNGMRDPEDLYRVSYLDRWLSSTNRLVFFGEIDRFNRLSDKAKEEFLDNMLVEGRSLYETNVAIATRLFKRDNHQYASLGLPGLDTRFYNFIPIDPHKQGGREASRMACKLAEETSSPVFLYCKRDGLYHISVRTGKGLHAGEIATQIAAYGSMNSGGGSETMGCLQLYPHEFLHLFRFHSYGKQVASNLNAVSCAVIKPDVPPESITRHYPPQKHLVAEYSLR